MEAVGWCILTTIMQIGFIGLGKMGSRMAGKLLKEGHELVVWNRSPQPIEDLKNNSAILTAKLQVAKTIEELAKSHNIEYKSKNMLIKKLSVNYLISF